METVIEAMPAAEWQEIANKLEDIPGVVINARQGSVGFQIGHTPVRKGKPLVRQLLYCSVGIWRGENQYGEVKVFWYPNMNNSPAATVIYTHEEFPTFEQLLQDGMKIRDPIFKQTWDQVYKAVKGAPPEIEDIPGIYNYDEAVAARGIDGISTEPVSAAVRMGDGEIYSNFCHEAIYDDVAGKVRVIDQTEGFLTNKGDFLDRGATYTLVTGEEPGELNADAMDAIIYEAMANHYLMEVTEFPAAIPSIGDFTDAQRWVLENKHQWAYANADGHEISIQVSGAPSCTLNLYLMNDRLTAGLVWTHWKNPDKWSTFDTNITGKNQNFDGFIASGIEQELARGHFNRSKGRHEAMLKQLKSIEKAPWYVHVKKTFNDLMALIFPVVEVEDIDTVYNYDESVIHESAERDWLKTNERGFNEACAFADTLSGLPDVKVYHEKWGELAKFNTISISVKCTLVEDSRINMVWYCGQVQTRCELIIPRKRVKDDKLLTVTCSVRLTMDEPDLDSYLDETIKFMDIPARSNAIKKFREKEGSYGRVKSIYKSIFDRLFQTPPGVEDIPDIYNYDEARLNIPEPVEGALQKVEAWMKRNGWDFEHVGKDFIDIGFLHKIRTGFNSGFIHMDWKIKDKVFFTFRYPSDKYSSLEEKSYLYPKLDTLEKFLDDAIRSQKKQGLGAFADLTQTKVKELTDIKKSELFQTMASVYRKVYEVIFGLDVPEIEDIPGIYNYDESLLQENVAFDDPGKWYDTRLFYYRAPATGTVTLPKFSLDPRNKPPQDMPIRFTEFCVVFRADPEKPLTEESVHITIGFKFLYLIRAKSEVSFSGGLDSLLETNWKAMPYWEKLEDEKHGFLYFQKEGSTKDFNARWPWQQIPHVVRTEIVGLLDQFMQENIGDMLRQLQHEHPKIAALIKPPEIEDIASIYNYDEALLTVVDDELLMEKVVTPTQTAEKKFKDMSPRERQLYVARRVADRENVLGARPLKPVRNEHGLFAHDSSGNPQFEKHNYDLANVPILGRKQIKFADLSKQKDIFPSEQFKYLGPLERKKLSWLETKSAVRTMAGLIQQSYEAEMTHMSEVMAGSGWYTRMTDKLKKAFGDDAEIFSQLLGATSARTPVRENFLQALDAYDQLRAGNFKNHIEKFLEAYGHLEKGTLRHHLHETGITPEGPLKTDAAAMAKWIDHHDILPKRKNGQKYNANSNAVLKVLAQKWLQLVKAPKTPNFAGNLTGRIKEATIDVWAARFVHELGHKNAKKPWLIQPGAEMPVQPLDFAFAQRAFRVAADNLHIEPHDLQAICWFYQKHLWELRGYTKGAGKEKSSFDETFDKIFSPSGERMSDDEIVAAFAKEPVSVEPDAGGESDGEEE